MDRHAGKPLLVLLVLSCLLVFPLVSSTPMPRSLRLGSQQQHPPALKLTSSQEMAIPAARMDFEVDDYPPPGHNHHHGPGAPAPKSSARIDFEVDDYPPPGHNHHHGPGAPAPKSSARMDFEVDDYPPPGHNHHHGPGAPAPKSLNP